MPDFPTLSKKPDGESYKVSVANPAAEPSDTDGGYRISRPKYTRQPPKTFRFKFSDIDQADRTALIAFWNTVKGSSASFNFTDPTTGTIHVVRFDKGQTLDFDRVGYGTNHRYDTNELALVEV